MGIWRFYGVLRNSDVCVNLTKARPTCSPFESWDLNTKTNAIFSEIRRLLLIRSKPVQTRILRAGLLADNNSQLNTQLNVHLARGLAIHHLGRRALFILLLIATHFYDLPSYFAFPVTAETIPSSHPKGQSEQLPNDANEIKAQEEATPAASGHVRTTRPRYCIWVHGRSPSCRQRGG